MDNHTPAFPPATGPPSLGALRLAFYTPVREYPPLADRKATILLAANSLMLTVLLFFSGAVERLFREGIIWLNILGALEVGCLGFLLAFGSYQAFKALVIPFPKLTDCVTFYGDIAAMPLEEYRRQARGVDYPEALRAMLRYNHAVSVLCVTKFRHVDLSTRCVRATFELWIILIVMISICQRIVVH